MLSRGEQIVPIVGARTVKQVEEMLEAIDLTLSEAELHALEQSVPASEVAGTRYDKQAMTHLDSER